MKNPLLKRLPREFLDDIGKYLVIFLFMTATIGFVSGFLIADNSMLYAYDHSFETYHVEDGNFTLEDEATPSTLKRLEKEQVKIYENFYLEEPAKKENGTEESTLRIYANRTEVNLVCLMKGNLPAASDEIAIDRMYADNNDMQIGDMLQVGSKKLLVTGLVALPDYSCLFSDNNDMMFDAVKFGVAITTQEGFDQFGTDKITYRYAFTYNNPPASEEEEKELSDSFMEVLAGRTTTSLKGYIPRYANQAIQFTGDDMGGDKSMMQVLLYILIVIMAFVFAVTTSNTISKEASVIGTLRASGYTRKELLIHYISLPLLVTLAAALVGNILGYTVFKKTCAAMYYGSYSLTTYKTLWNAEAFVMTTVLPLILMALINVCIIARKLRLSPLKFLRHDLGSSKNKRAVKLPDLRFFNRFRLRIILQNKSSYLMLFIGITFANILLLFGMMMSPLLSHYQDETLSNMLAKYQYLLNVSDEEPDKYSILWFVQELSSPLPQTDNPEAEKFCLNSLKTTFEGKTSESVSIYGIEPDSRYVHADFSALSEEGEDAQTAADSPKKVLISDGFYEKYKLKAGDTIRLKKSYESDTYDFEIAGTYHYPGAIAVFMPIDTYRQIFETSDEYFNGYFSNTRLTDLDEDDIASTITETDLTKISRQLNVSMGNLFYLINVFSIILFAMLIYLLTKLIIEKNASSISMVKILGYENREILSLYLTSTTWVVVASVLLSLVIATFTIKTIYAFMMLEFSGWLSFYIKPVIYPEMFLMGLAAYLLVALLQLRKIRQIPMDTALKNVE